jgi:hypothetical protein
LRKLTYFIACSIDGFIGDPGGDASAMFPFVDEEFLAFLKAEHPFRPRAAAPSASTTCRTSGSTRSSRAGPATTWP